jgi:drug/metabolite transporter (DMT)-like permease
MVTSFLLVTRIFSNPLSNVFQKKLTENTASPIFIILITHVLLTLAAFPILLQILPAHPSPFFWVDIAFCALLAISGNTLIVAALKLTDLSILGPINAYKSIVSLLLGIFLLGEFPTQMGIAGILLILAGSYFITDRSIPSKGQNIFIQFFKEKGIRLRLAALVLSAIEAVFLKKALLLSSPLITFVFWCILGMPVAAVAGLLILKTGIQANIATIEPRAFTYLMLAITTGLMQFSTIYTFSVFQVGYSLALFQTSALLSVLFGYKFFGEPDVMRRLTGASIMVIGAICIVVFGQST